MTIGEILESDGMTAKEIRAAIAETEDKLKVAGSIEDEADRRLIATGFIQQIRRLEAELARRNGTAPTWSG